MFNSTYKGFFLERVKSIDIYTYKGNYVLRRNDRFLCEVDGNLNYIKNVMSPVCVSDLNDALAWISKFHDESNIVLYGELF